LAETKWQNFGDIGISLCHEKAILKRGLFLVSFFVFGYAQADDVTIVWIPDRDDIVVWEIFVDGEVNQGIAGSSRSALIEVEHGMRCFKMRGHPFIGEPTRFSDSVCQQTNPDPDNPIEILIDFNGMYI
jgi:hypothetical protein